MNDLALMVAKLEGKLDTSMAQRVAESERRREAEARQQAELAELRKEMRDGFAEVNRRQDHTNGSVRELKVWRAKVEGWMAGVSVFTSPAKAIGISVAGAIAVAVITKLVLKL